MLRKSHDTSIQRRIAWIHPVSSFRDSSAAMAKANGMVMLM